MGGCLSILLIIKLLGGSAQAGLLVAGVLELHGQLDIDAVLVLEAAVKLAVSVVELEVKVLDWSVGDTCGIVHLVDLLGVCILIDIVIPCNQSPVVAQICSGGKVSAKAVDAARDVAGLTANDFSSGKSPVVNIGEAASIAVHLQIFVGILRYKLLGCVVECRISTFTPLEVTEEGERLDRIYNQSADDILALVVVCGIELVAVEHSQFIVDDAESVAVKSTSEEGESEVSS